MRQGATLVCGVDEVGRGALGGPVSVGAVVVSASTQALPGVRDSKALSPAVRESLAPRIRAWAVACSVGHASAAEIDAHGLVWALRQAGLRALAHLEVNPDAVILDGRHDWLSTSGQLSLLESDEAVRLPPVTMRVKADVTCTSVAAASVLAKVERDAILTAMSQEYPGYGWASNKAYASEEHRQGLERLGPSPEHRRSWRLGVSNDHEGAP
jgi:ribonuclease HII